jgi:hypothetical protein
MAVAVRYSGGSAFRDISLLLLEIVPHLGYSVYVDSNGNNNDRQDHQSSRTQKGGWQINIIGAPVSG